MRSFPLCLALLCAAPALAQQDGGFFSEGFFFDEQHGPLPALPLWEDQSGRVIAHHLSTQNLKCYRPDAGGFEFLQDLTDLGESRGTLLVGPGKDVFPLLTARGDGTFYIRYVTCGGAMQGSATYAFDAGMAPFVNPPTWPEAADGGHYYLSNSGLSLLAETPVPSVRLLHTHREIADLMGVKTADGGSIPGRISVSAMGTAPDGTLYFVVYARLPTGGQFDITQVDLIERTPQGELRRRFSQREPLTKVPDIVYSAAFDAVLVDGFTKAIGPDAVYPLLAVFPTGGAPGPLFPQGMPPWPVPPTIPIPHRTYSGLVGGSANVIHVNDGHSWHRLKPDPLRADYDRDGLRAVQEAQLGTSDFLADFDGDGRSDHAEVVRFHTDPRDAGSGPDVAAPSRLVFAPNHFTRMLPLFPAACRADNSFSFAPVVCSHDACLPHQPSADCFNPDLSLLANLPGNAFFIDPLDGGRPEHVMHPSQTVEDRWTITHIPTGAQTVHDNRLHPSSADAIPLSATKVLVRVEGPGRHQLVREGAGESFAVINFERMPCPILPNAAADCFAPEHASPPVVSYQRLGYAPELKGVLVSVDTTQGRTLYAVTDDDMVRLADITAAFGGLRPHNILPLSPAGSTGYLVTAQTLKRALFYGTYELDPAFGERTPPRRFFDVSGGTGAFFRTGYLDRLHTAYLTEESISGPRRYLPYQFEVEWEPVRPELQRGEVLSFGHVRYRYVGVADQVIFNPVTGVFEDSGTYAVPGWILWRTTPTGGTVEWLLRQEFEALLSVEDRAVLARTPLGSIRSMNASPDARKVCLAEPEAGRTWEVLLDANGKLEGARLGSATAGVGCAYDEASELVTLSKSPTAVRRGGTVLGTVPAMAVPIGLYRAGGSWMVQGHLEPMHCVADSGAVSSSGVVVTAMSVIPGGVAYIQGDGHAFTATSDDLCQGLGPSESLSGGSSNLWSTAYNRFTYRTVNAVQGSMVMRPDGLMFISGFDLDVSGLGRNPQVVPQLTFNVWPRFRPVGEKRFPAHDGFRIEKELTDVSSISAVALQAMTILPGASPTRDWGYVQRLGTPLDTSGGGADAGVPDAGVPGPGPKDPGGCDCASAGSAAPLLALALLALAQRRRGPRRR
jgi:uncharacterized protein (TIGR03382 family)